MPTTLPFCSINPTAAHRTTVIFLHGLGDQGYGWQQFFKSTIAKQTPNVKYVFPHAPEMPITLNYGMSMPGWYDIKSLSDISDHEDAVGLQKSKEKLLDLIENEKQASNLSEENIIVGGFSQGGAVALYTALTHSKKFKASLILSSYLPLNSTYAKGNVNDHPIFMAHGDMDNVIPLNYAERSVAKLKNDLSLSEIEFKIYKRMAHSSCEAEESDILSFLRRKLEI